MSEGVEQNESAKDAAGEAMENDQQEVSFPDTNNPPHKENPQENISGLCRQIDKHWTFIQQK